MSKEKMAKRSGQSRGLIDFESATVFLILGRTSRSFRPGGADGEHRSSRLC
jgi:hypothetical protein